MVAVGSGHLSEDALLALVASVEEHASHPLAQAVVVAARERDLKHITHGEVDYLVAHGLSTDVDGKRVIIGSRHFLEEHHGVSFAEHEAVICRLQEEGKTLLYVGSAGQDRAPGGPIGVVALRDTLRADAADTLQRLRALGIKQLIMITGDRRAKAEALAADLGLDAVHADVAPEDKAEIIKGLQAQGCKVAFVGDGINDGPALSVAQVGIAMPRGADIARATADIVLLDDRLTAVADAREIASRTMALIRSNFKLAVGVNTGFLPGVERVTLNTHAGSLTVNYDRQALSQHELLAALDATGCLYVAADVQAVPTARTSTPGEGVADAFGKALVGVLAQRTVTRIIGALL